MTYKEINIFLASFNTYSYNKSQIGSDKGIIISIFEFLKRINIEDDKINELITHIAYLRKKEVNLPLFLEILSKSLSYEEEYDLKDIIDISLRVHNIYEDNGVDLSDYIHENNDYRLKMLFLYRNKYIKKTFYEEETLSYIDELKLAAAIKLETNEYKEFTEYLNNITKKNYSPFTNLNIYLKLRSNVKGLCRLFFDIFFGNEYLVALSKNNINITEIYQQNFNKKATKPQQKKEPVQLDIFNYEEVLEEKKVVKDINAFQIEYIYNSDSLPDLVIEKDIIEYYKSLLENKRLLILPKLKTQKYSTYVYETNL